MIGLGFLELWSAEKAYPFQAEKGLVPAPVRARPRRARQSMTGTDSHQNGHPFKPTVRFAGAYSVMLPLASVVFVTSGALGSEGRGDMTTRS